MKNIFTDILAYLIKGTMCMLAPPLSILLPDYFRRRGKKDAFIHSCTPMNKP